MYDGPHVLVPFAIEDGDSLGAHALSLLKALATVAEEKGWRAPLAHRAHAFSAPTLTFLWVQRWRQRLSTWLHLVISMHVMRLLWP